MKLKHLSELYRLQVDSHEHDSARYWAIFNLMSVINGGLIAIVIATGSDATIEFWLSLFGLMNCLVWFMVQRRFGYYVICYKVRRYVLGKYYLKAVHEGQTDDDHDIDIEPLDLKVLATQYFTRLQLKEAPGKEGTDQLPRFYYKPPPEVPTTQPAAGIDAPDPATESAKIPRRNDKYPGWASMTVGQWMPVFFGLLWALFLPQWLPHILRAPPVEPEARILEVQYDDEAITITVQVPSSQSEVKQPAETSKQDEVTPEPPGIPPVTPDPTEPQTGES